LTEEDRLAIHRRYYDRLRSGETVAGIAADFKIARQWLAKVAREVELTRRGASDEAV